VGIALFLNTPGKYGKTVSNLRSTYPGYFISKNKITLTPEMDIDALLLKVEEKYKNQPHTTIDGLKIEFDKEGYICAAQIPNPLFGFIQKVTLKLWQII